MGIIAHARAHPYLLRRSWGEFRGLLHPETSISPGAERRSVSGSQRLRRECPVPMQDTERLPWM